MALCDSSQEKIKQDSGQRCESQLKRAQWYYRWIDIIHTGEREKGEVRKREKRQEGREEQETQQRQERYEIQVAHIQQALVFTSAQSTC